MADTIRKYKRVANFTTVNNEYLQDVNISWKAKGLITYIMSLPEDWRLNLTDLKKRSKDRREATASGLKELIKWGYCHRVRLRSKKGTFLGCDYEVADTRVFVIEQPKTENPISVIPSSEAPFSENPSLINTNSNKETYIPNTKGNKESLQIIKNKRYGDTNEQRQKAIEQRTRAAIEQTSSDDLEYVW